MAETWYWAESTLGEPSAGTLVKTDSLRIRTI
jgi:hypothetical protein